MKSKEFLSQYIRANKEIDRLCDEVWRLRHLAEKCTTTLRQNSPSGGGFDNDKIGLLVSKIVDMEREIDNQIDALQNVRRNVVNAIDTVDNNTLREVLKLRYLSNMSWEEIAVEMGYVYRHVTRLHGLALQQVRCPKS